MGLHVPLPIVVRRSFGTARPDVPECFVSPVDIMRIICWWHEVTIEELTGSNRTQEFARARSAASWCMRATMKLSYASISRRLGGRDYSTIYSCIQRACDLWNLPPAEDAGSDLIARHYLKTGEWDVTKAKDVSA